VALPNGTVGPVTTPPTRETVDLSAYPDIVVMYLGMRVEEPRGARTLQELGPQIQAAVDERPTACCCTSG
jgi:hypothetical protein